MHLSPSPPPQTPVMTLDESCTALVKSPLPSVEQVTPHTGSPPSSSQPLVPPAPSNHSIVSTSIPMPEIQSKIQPNSPSQNPTATPISSNCNTSCLIFTDTSASLQCDQPVKLSSQPRDSGIVDQIPLSTKAHHAITPSFSFPGAASSANTHNCTFANSVDYHTTLTAASSTESLSAITTQRTPNVYINGLPPNYSEQDLFALTRPFGDIKSVRTFTRHVSEKPTGYGFVLFSDLESAQRCIEGLRKNRNLHPSFSKQIHRIPGTEYAQQNAVHCTDQDENSFKSRMEKLKDTASTNLYIEGLPLSIDEESLAGLMLPYKIKSSRFFKTKLSNPPRMIAFVRLETRAAAEETIEHLHGRMVRGWNDPGCRISVRFADSTEQRELRRAERTLKNGEQSPSRLTIAQAALLNLRGQELQANMRNVAGPRSQRFSNSRPDGQAPLDPGCQPVLLPTSRSLPSKLSYTHIEPPLVAPSDIPSTSEMNALLQSIQNEYEDGSLDSAMRNLTLEHLATQQHQLRGLASAALLSPNLLPASLPRGHTQARNGFTAAEELILEAHAQHLQLQARLSQPPPVFEPSSTLRQRLNGAVRSLESAPHTSLQLAAKGMSYQDALPTISEDDFHGMGHPARSFALPFRESQGLVDGHLSNIPAITNPIFVHPPSRAVSIVPPPPDYDESGKRPKGQHQHVEQSLGSKQIPNPSPSFDNRQSIRSGKGKTHPSLLSTRSSNINSINNDNSTTSCDKNNELQHTYMYSHCETHSRPEDDEGSRFRVQPASHTYLKKLPTLGEQHSAVKEGLNSPCVVSPALTYSSRTPSTLSPATPFFGSFMGSQDAFQVVTMENEDVSERKLKGRAAKN